MGNSIKNDFACGRLDSRDGGLPRVSIGQGAQLRDFGNPTTVGFPMFGVRLPVGEPTGKNSA